MSLRIILFAEFGERACVQVQYTVTPISLIII